MIETILLLIVCIPIFLLGNIIYSKSINPINIFVGINLISILLPLLLNEFEGYSIRNTLSFVVMFVSFTLGVVICSQKGNKISKYSYIRSSDLYKLIIFSSIIYDIALVFYLQNMFSNYSLTQFFLEMGEVNKYVQSDEFHGGLYSYVVPIGLPLSLIILYYSKHFKNSIFLWIQYFVCFLHCISPRRSELFNMFIVTIIYIICTNDYFKKRLSIKQISFIGISVIIFIFVMEYTQNLMGKSSGDDIYLLSYKLPHFLNDVFIYLSLNYPYIETMDYSELTSCSTIFSSTFRLIYIYINPFLGNIIDTREQFDLDFLNIGGPYTTNTAPIIYYAYKDLGDFYFIDFIFLGYISHKAYLYLLSPGIFNRIFGSLIYCMLFLSSRSYLLIFLIVVLYFLYTYLFSKLVKLSRWKLS